MFAYCLFAERFWLKNNFYDDFLKNPQEAPGWRTFFGHTAGQNALSSHGKIVPDEPI